MKEPKKSSSSRSISDIRPGDIVTIYAPQTGYPKYHLCISAPSSDVAAQFFFINSEDKGYEGVFVVPNKEVPCLPPCESGVTVFSFTQIPRFNKRQLNLYRAEVRGRISVNLAKKLLTEVRNTPVLTGKDRKTAIAALEYVIKLI